MISLIKSIVDMVYKDRRLLMLVMVINIMGSLFGVYYYWDQLMMTPPYLWIFVPDCPLYTFFMVLILTGLMSGRMSDTFNAITAVGLSMYGAWTMLVLAYFSEIFFAPQNMVMSSVLFVAHLGMALECVLLLPYLKDVKAGRWLIAGAWFLAQVTVDYFYSFMYHGSLMRTHPLAIMEYYARMSGYGMEALLPKLDTLMLITYAMVFIFLAAIIALSKAWPDNARKVTSVSPMEIKGEGHG